MNGIIFNFKDRSPSSIYIGSVNNNDTLDLNSDVMYKAIQENWGKVSSNTSDTSLLDIYQNASNTPFGTVNISLNNNSTPVNLVNAGQKVTNNATKWDLEKGVATFDGTITTGLNPSKTGVVVQVEITKIEINDGKQLDISGRGTGEYTNNQSNEKDYLIIQKGITGAGGIKVTDNLYLRGQNTFTGPVTVNPGKSLVLWDKDALANVSDITLEAGAELWFGNFKSGQTNKTIPNLKRLTLHGSPIANASEKTYIRDGYFNLSGNEAYLSIDDGGTAASSGTLEASLHRAFVELTNGALLKMNYYDKFDPKRSHLAVLAVGYYPDDQKTYEKSTLTIGKNSEARIGNGYIKVLNKSELTLDQNSSIYLGSHADGLFEQGSTTPENKHFSIELEAGSTLNVKLDENNKIHADHIISKDHTHAVIGKLDATENTPWFNLTNTETGTAAAGVNLSMTQSVIDRVTQKVQAYSQEDQVLAGQDNIKALKKLLETGELSTKQTTLQGLYDAVVTNNKKLTSEEFYNAMGAFLTLGLKREEGWQDYRFTMDANGVYINGESIRQWGNMTQVKLSLQNLTNETVAMLFNDHDHVPVSGAVNLIHHVVEYNTMDKNPPDFYLAARMIDSAGQLISVGGAQTIAWDMLQNRRDSFSRQRDRAFERILPKETNLWADGLYMRNSSNGLWNDLNGDRDVDTDLSGVIVGLDHKVNSSLLLGGSLSVLRGDSTGELGAGLPKVENQIDSYAGSLYGAWAFTDNSRFVWDVALQNGKNDVSMELHSWVGDKPLFKTEADADTWAAQVTAGYQYDFHLANVTLTPFALLQYTYLRTQDYTSTVDGLDAFHVDATKQNIFSIPVGVKASADFSFGENLALRPWMSLYVQPNFGDKDVDNRVTAVGLNSVDHVQPDVIGDTSYGAAVGMNFITGETFSSGLSYSFNGSDSSKNHSFTLNAVWKF